ncbi:uncharacterized protein LOC110190726 [Drosophila serrata]|uniref:uncharacterized protein LOC110190726 n=1 Tax=Drosophila serrata TaxID=7274 RepID=UPI000A1CF34E|nr:uncharacterized protein LOC110190726 [Drosophila serrata]
MYTVEKKSRQKAPLHPAPLPQETSKTATTAARIFSRLDSVEEVQRGRSGSAVGITPPGGPGAAGGAAGGAGSGSGAVAATAVAVGSPARSGHHQQQQFGVGPGTGAAAIRQRSASTVLDIGLQQRKVSVGGGVGVVGGTGAAGAGPPSPGILHKRTGFNGFGGYEAPVIPNRQDILNGPGVGVGGTASSFLGQQQQQRQQEDQYPREPPSGRQQVALHPASQVAHPCPCRDQSDRAASRMSSPS